MFIKIRASFSRDTSQRFEILSPDVEQRGLGFLRLEPGEDWVGRRSATVPIERMEECRHFLCGGAGNQPDPFSLRRLRQVEPRRTGRFEFDRLKLLPLSCPVLIELDVE